MKFDEYLILKGNFHILNSMYLSVHLPTYLCFGGNISHGITFKNILIGLRNISYGNKMIREALKRTVYNYFLWQLNELKMYGNCSCNGIYLERKLLKKMSVGKQT